MARPDFDQLVVIGASAGGIDALSTVVASLPADFAAPIVIAQHLHPGRESSLSEILGRHTSLPVRIVADRSDLEPGVVYVAPANRHVEITDHEMRLETANGRGPKPSVDRLLTTAARVFGDRLVAVILTGSGSDGAAGARDVKLAGGTVIIQNPETASFPSMPRSLAPTAVDFVAELDEVGPLLGRLIQRAETTTGLDEDGTLGLFLDRIRSRSGIDFNSYKRPTVLRRLHRRMTASGSATLAEYVRHVEQNPDEYRRLVGDFLIKVTEFFRDPKLFAYLGTKVMPETAKEALAGSGELRFWSAGCATGEEAYSLAILAAETLGDRLRDVDVRIFATDLDRDAITFARRGVYSAAAVANMPGELRERYFTARDGEYEVNKVIRALTVFGEHDLATRAPFPRIDLVLCRNVLIYFVPDLQRRALQAFAFSLRQGGRLVLGPSETVAPLPAYFAPEDTRLKVFRREGAAKLVAPAVVHFGPAPSPIRRGSSAIEAGNRGVHREPERSRGATEHEARLFQDLPFGIVVVDRQYDVQQINVAARRLLNIHGTAYHADFVHLAEVLPASPLRSAIDLAARGEASVQTFAITTADMAPDERRHLELRFQPFGSGGSELVLIAVRDATSETESRQMIERLTAQLERSAEGTRRLLTANEEVTAANAVLRAANDEFLLSSEEAQSGREEVETLNEELQATNEELETLNEELQASVEELNTANDDLLTRSRELDEQAAMIGAERSRVTSILASMGDAVLAVDLDGRMVFTNAAYTRMFGEGELVPEDEAGRPLPSGSWPQNRAARGEAFQMAFTVMGGDGERRWFEAQAEPIGGNTGAWSGVVVIRDITDRSLRHLQERFMATASHELRTPIAVAHGYLQRADRQLRTGNVEEAARYVAEAVAQTRSLAQLAGRLFDVAQIERGGLAIERRPFDLVDLVQRWAPQVAQLLDEQVAIEVVSTAPGLVVDGDAARIEQVLFNLVTNAAVHGGGGGHVEVRLASSGTDAQIEVEDHGPGIPPDALSTLFSRFDQVEPGDERRGGGLGLGLYLSREIVAAHGGSIAVNSTVGKGTTVTVRLPLSPTRTEPARREKREDGLAGLDR